MSLYDGRKKTGYSLEEAYFHEENKRLVEELRRKETRSDDTRSKQGVVIEASERFEQRREQAKDSTRKKAA